MCRYRANEKYPTLFLKNVICISVYCPIFKKKKKEKKKVALAYKRLATNFYISIIHAFLEERKKSVLYQPNSVSIYHQSISTFSDLEHSFSLSGSCFTLLSKQSVVGYIKPIPIMVVIRFYCGS